VFFTVFAVFHHHSAIKTAIKQLMCVIFMLFCNIPMAVLPGALPSDYIYVLETGLPVKGS